MSKANRKSKSCTSSKYRKSKIVRIPPNGLPKLTESLSKQLIVNYESSTTIATQ
jgi:hypothetical protein